MQNTKSEGALLQQHNSTLQNQHLQHQHALHQQLSHSSTSSSSLAGSPPVVPAAAAAGATLNTGNPMLDKYIMDRFTAQIASDSRLLTA